MGDYLTLLYTPVLKIVQIPQSVVTRRIPPSESVIQLMWSAVEGGEEEKWIRETLLRPDQWPCILVCWKRHRRLFRQEHPLKDTTTILYPEESPGEVWRKVERFTGKHLGFEITRSDVGRLEIMHSHREVNVHLQREEESRPFVSFALTLRGSSLSLTLELWLEYKVMPVEARVGLAHYCETFDVSFIRAAVEGETTEVIPRGIVMLAGKPCENHLVYVCADPEPLLRLLSPPRR